MKKRLQGFFAGVLAMALAVSVFSVAKNRYEKIDVIYNDIGIVIDGTLLVPTDANGNRVEPFIYNGTTFLPVRAIAGAFDKQVRWDSETYTVYIDSRSKETSADDKADITVKPDENSVTELVGIWRGDLNGVLTELDVPEELVKDKGIYIFLSFNLDGTYKMYIDEEGIDKLVDASFMYALEANGISIENYPQYAGISVEETKKQIRNEINPEDLSETGSFRAENKTVYMTVEGRSEKACEYTLNNDALKINMDGVVLEFVRG